MFHYFLSSLIFIFITLTVINGHLNNSLYLKMIKYLLLIVVFQCIGILLLRLFELKSKTLGTNLPKNKNLFHFVVEFDKQIHDGTLYIYFPDTNALHYYLNLELKLP